MLEEHTFYPQNLYKLHLNNIHNIVDGTAEGKFKLDLPSYFPLNKRCYIFVESCQVQVRKNPYEPVGDFLAVSSNLVSPNSYTNQWENQTGVLCNLCVNTEVGRNSNTKYRFDDTATKPIYLGYLPSQIELYISKTDANNNTPFLMTNMNFTIILCVQFIEDTF